MDEEIVKGNFMRVCREALKGLPQADTIMDVHLVNSISGLMESKLLKSRKKGRGGWWDPERCSIDSLRQLLKDHVEKGDMVDVCNIAAMIKLRELMDTPESTFPREHNKKYLSE